MVTFTEWSGSSLRLRWERQDPWTRSKYFWPAAFGCKIVISFNSHPNLRNCELEVFSSLYSAKITARYGKVWIRFGESLLERSLTAIVGPVNRASVWCQLDPSQKCQRMIPSTAGWLKNRVRSCSSAAALPCSSEELIVSSVIQIFSPASATLSSLYCVKEGQSSLYWVNCVLWLGFLENILSQISFFLILRLCQILESSNICISQNKLSSLFYLAWIKVYTSTLDLIKFDLKTQI